MKVQHFSVALLRPCVRLVATALFALLATTPAYAVFTQQENGLVVIEAENGTLSGNVNPWNVGADSSASSGGYISAQSNSWNQNTSGVSTYVFSVRAAEEALIYMRKRGSGNSVWISIDGRTISGPASSEAVYTPDGGWIWASGFGATKFTLREGEHTLQIKTREADLLIDKIVIAPLNDRTITIGSNAIGPAESSEELTDPPVTIDSDGDGVSDDLDDCPAVAGPVDNQGCPVEVSPPTPTDTDGDGVSDDLDDCPEVAGPADNQGCPVEVSPPTSTDTDGDGISDDIDDCPEVAGTADNHGCPEVTTPPATTTTDGLVILEAESAAVSAGSATWVEASSQSNASNNSYMRTTNNVWNKASASTLNFSFNTAEAMDAVVYLRKAGAGTSLWLSIDGQTISAIPSSQALYMPASGWLWSNSFGAARIQLPAGQHTLRVFARSNDMLLDKIVIAPVDDSTIVVGSSAIGPTGSDVVNPPALDSDGDGIIDSEDSCPAVYGTDANGCPVVASVDSDEDGIIDSEDACPAVYGTGSDGCPVSTGGSNTVTDFSRFPGSVNYSKPVTLPACDANAVRISSINDIRLLESSNADVFCIAPGDYRSAGNGGAIIINNKHGSASSPKVIQLDSSLGINDVIFDLPQSQLALLPPIEFENSSHWLVDRMAFFDVGDPEHTGHVAVKMHASTNIILNRLRMESNYGSVNFYHGSHNSVLQNSLVGHSANLFPDNTCVSLMGGLKFAGSESIYNSPPNGASEIFNVGLYNNELVNCNDAIHFLWDPREGSRESYIYNNPTYWPDYQGAQILGNDIYIDNRVRTDCYGNSSSSGLCAKAENAIDIKAGSKSPANPVLIKDNRMWGFRKADGYNLSDHGAAVSLHFIPAKNIEITENIIWDSGAGIAMTRGVSDITVHNNIMHSIFNDNGQRPIYGNTGISVSAGGTEAYYGRSSNVEISYNNIIDSGGPWGLINSVTNTTIDCNVVVATEAANTWFNPSTSANSQIGRNSYYGGVRGSNLEPSGSVIRSSSSDARMAQACFTVGVASQSGGVRKCLAGALNTNSSPHACSSDVWSN